MQHRKKCAPPFHPNQLRTVMKALHPARDDRRSQLLERKEKRSDGRETRSRHVAADKQNRRSPSSHGTKTTWLHLSHYFLVTKISLDRL